MRVLYPQTCCFCGKICGSDICHECEKEIEYISKPVCDKCGKPITYGEGQLCFDCSKQPMFYEQGRSLWLHKGPVKQGIYQFKYHNRRYYGLYYADELYRCHEETIRQWGIDVIIPVPLHRKRKRKRGYNQAEIVARQLGKRMGILVDTRAVVRSKYTTAQKELSHSERKQNVRDAFEVVRMKEKVKNILIIDDIYTTGSTINELSRILRKKGDFRVFFLTISIGQGF